MNKDTTTAFPSKIYDYNSNGQVVREVYHGMDLRDYFAAKVLNGIVFQAYGSTPDLLAEKAYECADAMMKARLK